MNLNNFLAILYADIFDFPLKKEEVEKWQINDPIIKTCCQLNNLIKEKDGLYFLRGREEIVKIRKQKEKSSKGKLKIAKDTASLLKMIPTIKMVAISGALAVKNANENDDIDLLIITTSVNLWLTRFLTTILIELTGRRRHPDDKNFKDKICLNMFIDENHLSLPKDERNLYTAHEVGQLLPIWERNNTYPKFLKENEWVREYLPKAIKKCTMYNVQCINKKKRTSILEKFLKNLQLWYMKKRQTTEKINDGRIMFHPEDKTKWVLKEYNRRIDKFIKS